MAFSPEFIDQVRQANDIVQVIQTWVPLKKAGASWKGLCPFHQERTPSFNVVPSKQIFHCFGCGEGGDVFAFIQKREKVDFVEALKRLAERAGIALPEESRDESGRLDAERRRKEEEAHRGLVPPQPRGGLRRRPGPGLRPAQGARRRGAGTLRTGLRPLRWGGPHYGRRKKRVQRGRPACRGPGGAQ
jgi:CHC2 zinc finger